MKQNQSQILIDQLVDNLEAKKPLQSIYKRSFVIFALIFIIGFAMLFVSDSQFLQHLSVRSLSIFIVCSVLSFLTLLSATSLSVPGHMMQKTLLRCSTVFAFLFFTVFIGIGLIESSSSPERTWSHCSKTIMLLSSVPILSSLWMIFKGYVIQVFQTIAFATLSSGLLVAGIHQLECQPAHPMHHFTWHFLPVIGLSILGLVIWKLYQMLTPASK